MSAYHLRHYQYIKDIIVTGQIVRPRLRPVDIRPIQQRGQTAYLLRDPLALSERSVIVPHFLGPVLLFCDGTRDVSAICEEIIESYGLMLTPPIVEEMITALDSALLLDNARSAEARNAAVAAYRAAPFRPMSHAGLAYSADPVELSAQFDDYIDEAGIAGSHQISGRGVFSPHIDYARGGPVYGAVWKQAEEGVQEADLVILLATDHSGGELVTLTQQNYATPFGVLPTDQDVVGALAAAIGQEQAFADELHHRGEHSIELVATWLHYTRQQRPCRLVPILCGSFAPFVRGTADLATDPTIHSLVKTLQDVLSSQRAIVVASGDLSHVGPAFGGPALDQAGWDMIKNFDAKLIEQLCAGDADRFFSSIKAVDDDTNVCGVSPFYLALKVLSEPAGTLAAYDRCPADDDYTSLVSVCGIGY